MFANTLGVQCSSPHHSEVHTIIKAIRSFINSTPHHQRKTPEFISDLTQRLYLLHDYNCQVARRTGKYPTSRKLDLLLVKYIELEFDCLYHKNSDPSQDVMITTESRVFHLLQTMLNQVENVIHQDAALKSTMLQLLGKLRLEYLTKNKLVDNIVQKLRETGGSGSKTSSVSGYGSDDLQTDFLCNASTKSGDDCFGRSDQKIKSETDSVIICSDSEDDGDMKSSGVVTFEILDDDDSDDLNYMVYLHKETKTNRKCKKQTIMTDAIVVCSDSEDEDTNKNITGNVYVNVGAKEENVAVQSENVALFDAMGFETDTIHGHVEAAKEKYVLASKDCVEIANILNLNDNQEFSLKSDYLAFFDQSNKTEELPLMTEIDNQRVAARGTCEELMDNSDVLGDPVLAEKLCANVDFDSFSEDGINASLLEEFLLDDSYLVEGRKEFEQLENFLFYESPEKL